MPWLAPDANRALPFGRALPYGRAPPFGRTLALAGALPFDGGGGVSNHCRNQ
jgi:hypothetical protein